MKNNDINVRVSANVDQRTTRDLNRLGKDTRAARRTMGEGIERDTRQTARFEQSHHRLGGTLGRQSRRIKTYTKDLAKAAHQNRAFRLSLQGINKGLNVIDNKWAAAGGALGGTMMARGVVDLSARYERLGIQAGLSSDKVKELKDQVFAISQQRGIRVDDMEVLAAIEQVVERTGDLDLARRNIANIARTLQATGAAGQDVGAMVADMSEKFGIKTADDMIAQLDTLVVQGKEGAFTLQALARKGSRVSAAYAAMGRTGAVAVREMGALLQISMRGAGESDVAATAFDATLRDLVSNRDKLNGLGVELFDPEKLAQGKEQMRSVPKILKEIITASQGNITVWGEIFGDESRKLVNDLAKEYNQTGSFKTLDKFLNIQGDGSQIMEDSARASQTAAAAMNNFINAWRRMADGNLAGPIQSLADALNSIDPDTVQTVMKGIAGGALALGGMAIGRRVLGAGKAVAGFLGKGKAGKGGGAMGGALAGASGTTPVFVTNFPGGFGGTPAATSKAKRNPYSGGFSKNATRPTTRASRLTQLGQRGGGAMKLMGKAALPLMLAGGALSIGSTLSDEGLSRAEKTKAVSSDVGGMGGAMAGAAAGAALGSIVPVIGTTIGGVLGGILGGLGGGWLGGKVGDAVNPMEKEVQKAIATKKPGAGSAGAAPVVSQTFSPNVSIPITQRPGENAEELASRVEDAVEKVFEKERRKGEMALTDNYALGGA